VPPFSRFSRRWRIPICANAARCVQLTIVSSASSTSQGFHCAFPTFRSATWRRQLWGSTTARFCATILAIHQNGSVSSKPTASCKANLAEPGSGLKALPGAAWLYWAWAGLGLLLAGELVALTLPFHAETDLAGSSAWVWLGIYLQESFRPIFATAAVAAVFLSRDTLRDEVRRVLSGSSRVLSLRWFTAHVAILGVLLAGSIARHDGRLTSVEAWEGWLLAWMVLAAAALGSWCLAAMPASFWANWIRRSPLALAAGAGAGIAASLLGMAFDHIWWLLERPTFQVVAILLRLLGQTIVADPQALTIDTPFFGVQIGPACSGLEGVGLIIVFVSIYLRYRRRELIFPRALILLPIGVLAVWLMNAMRIAMFVMIGNWDADVAVRGFHSVAGWLFFNAAACGLVWASWHLRLFTRSGPEHDAGPRPATLYLLPLLLLLVTTTIVRAFAPRLEVLYPAGIVAGLIVLWIHCADLRTLRWDFSWRAIAAGIAAFAVWYAWSGGAALGDAMMLGGRVAPLRAGSGWLKLGLVGAVIAVPLSEELAFRGYAIRRLVAADFAAVPFTQFRWQAFLGSSLAFGVLHAAWLPATLAGMLYASIVYWRGRLADAIVAHVTSCGLLLLCALVWG